VVVSPVVSTACSIFNLLPEWALNFHAAVRRRDREAAYAQLRSFVLPCIAIRNHSSSQATVGL
jgi:5-dehydro-4-deoxyglucarate dehydratase